MEQQEQGYEAKFVHLLLKRHKCPICLFAMRNPVQTECGHLFCRKCLEPVLQRLHPVCPLDREDISRDGIFPDNACRREILNLEVNCNFVSGGCMWVGHLKELEGHVETCQYCEIQCKQCGQYIQSRILQVHQDKECPMRPVPCPHCGKDIPHQQMEDHIKKKCPYVLHACLNGCNPALKMKLPELEQHISVKLGTCPLAEIRCPFYSYGCTFVSMRKHLPAHLEQYQVYHCQIQAESYQELKQAVDKNSTSLQHLLECTSSLESRTSAVERLQDALEQRMELIDERHEHAMNRYDTKIENVEEQSGRLVMNVADLTRKVDNIEKTGKAELNTNQSTNNEATNDDYSDVIFIDLEGVRCSLANYGPSDTPTISLVGGG